MVKGWNSDVKDPQSLEERNKVAQRCAEALDVEFPVVVDRMDDKVAVEWAGWPERLFVIGKEGKVIYAGGQGPWGFKPQELGRFLSHYCKKEGL